MGAIANELEYNIGDFIRVSGVGSGVVIDYDLSENKYWIEDSEGQTHEFCLSNCNNIDLIWG